jgi:hypothetical protein
MPLATDGEDLKIKREQLTLIIHQDVVTESRVAHDGGEHSHPFRHGCGRHLYFDELVLGR